MFCSKCGCKLNNEALFCHNCGEKVSINKNLENSKYESEKENIIAKVEMNNKNYINKDEGISNKKQNDDIYKACKYSGKMFNEIDDEIIENMDIEGCNKNK